MVDTRCGRIFFVIDQFDEIIIKLRVICFQRQSNCHKRVDKEPSLNLVLLAYLNRLLDEAGHELDGFMNHVWNQVKFGCQILCYLEHFVDEFSLIFLNEIQIQRIL